MLPNPVGSDSGLVCRLGCSRATRSARALVIDHDGFTHDWFRSFSLASTVVDHAEGTDRMERGDGTIRGVGDLPTPLCHSG